MDVQFNLKKDIVFFDIEATGLNVLRDRIVQIALIKYFKDNREPEELSMLINPGIPIPQESTNIHGITVDMVRNKPTFAQVGEQIFNFIGDSDISGYNSDRFDIPMLMEEFDRIGLTFSMDIRTSVDVQKIFYKMEPRTLKAAYKHYCGAELVDAHDALADVRATVEVLKGQIKAYEGVDYVDGDNFVTKAPIINDMEAIAAFTSNGDQVDVTQRLKYDSNGVVIFNFGKYIGKPVGETLYNDRQYYNWILDKEFSAQVKQMVKKLFTQYEKSRTS